jgi:capsule polysaccharide export protein KpsE/RkpR
MSSLLTQLGQKTKVELDKKLALAGGTMTGALTLSGAPTANLHAATKAYVDSAADTSALQTELDATQAGAGLGANGAYTANSSANYISSVATLQAADNALDAQIKTNADAIASNDSDISTLQANVSSNDSDISTLQSNVSSNDSDISSLQSDVSTAQSDITTLQSNVTSNDSDISTLQSNVSSNDSDISALQTRAGSIAADGNSASFSGDVSAANAVFSGNLTVQGTTTSVQTTNIDVSDSLMNLSKGAASGANASNDGGFIVERGSSESNVALIWDEGDDKFKVLSTSATAASTDISGTDSSAAAAKFDADLYHNGTELGTVAEFESALS